MDNYTATEIAYKNGYDKRYEEATNRQSRSKQLKRKCRMTDNEIIKALECCTNNYCCPTECPLYETDGDCLIALYKPTLDLINRQKAKIERLEYEIMKTKLEKHLLNETVEEIKAEAIKEFVEKLKNNLTACSRTIDGKCKYLVCDYEIDNLVKEMVGDD